MNIDGLDYNTQREKLVLPAFGREIQNMVDYAVAIPDRKERQRCAETIVEIMRRVNPQNFDNKDEEQSLWDHIAVMSDFKLDIDYPVDVSKATKIVARPGKVEYSMTRIPVHHYGHILFEMFDKLKSMDNGPQRDELIKETANQMKRNLMMWSHGLSDDEKVATDLARFTDGTVQLDLDSFKFSRVMPQKQQPQDKKRRRK